MEEIRVKDKLYVFCHIPKTGGVTFKNLMENNFKVCRHFSPPFDRIKSLDSNDIDFISGHFDIEFPERSELFTDREIIKFTFLRDPISRSLSFYDWSDKGDNKFDFSEFFENDRNTYYKGNTMTKFLSGISVSGVDVTEENYQKALKNLENVNVGFTEEFDKSIKRFASKYPEVFKSIEYVKTNQSPVKYKPSEDDIRLVESVNYFDIRLYNEIRGVAE